MFLFVVLISPQFIQAFSCVYACVYACAYLTNMTQAYGDSGKRDETLLMQKQNKTTTTTTNKKIKVKSQQPWIAGSALLGLISMA